MVGDTIKHRQIIRSIEPGSAQGRQCVRRHRGIRRCIFHQHAVMVGGPSFPQGNAQRRAETGADDAGEGHESRGTGYNVGWQPCQGQCGERHKKRAIRELWGLLLQEVSGRFQGQPGFADAPRAGKGDEPHGTRGRVQVG